MKSNNFLLRCIVMLLPLLMLQAGCGGGGGGGGNQPAPALVSVAITPANVSIAPGASQQFTATVTFSDGTTRDLTNQVTWSATGNPAGVVQIGATSGLASSPTAGPVGTATITATIGAISGSTTLTVALPTLVSITVTPANPSIAQGASQQFSATGNFSDRSTQDLTSQVTWSSTGAAQVGATGLATSSGSGAVGAATITATLGTIAGSTTLTVTGTSAANVMAVSVDGSLCSPATSSGYFNKPCVSVTVCNPDNSNCQTVNDILLDTGSYGLRIYRQAIPGLTLGGSTTLGQCIQFADGSSLWGAVKLASVQLAGEPAIQIPIQVIDSSFVSGGIPASCANSDQTPAAAGYTGILGVGPFAEDCGSRCASRIGNGIYFNCAGSSCTGTTVAITDQVQNPVASLPADSNGVLLQFQPVALGGVPTSNGSLILGINTRANNIPASPTVIPIDSSGDFTTVFNGVADSSSFLDTGSNALFFSSTLPRCASPNAVWYCPATTTPLSATVGAGQTVFFNVGNFTSLTSTSNEVFSEIGGTSSFGFDWGLPFFFGRSVFIGIDARGGSALGTGPFVAF